MNFSRTYHHHNIKDDAPILASGARAPDKRQVSFRWLTGVFLTAITSISLMGVALFAALDGKEQLALPAVSIASTGLEINESEPLEKTSRLRTTTLANRETDKLLMEVPTLETDGDQQFVRPRPFVLISMPLAANYLIEEEYPTFDPLQIFATDTSVGPNNFRSADIYGAKLESEIALKSVPFPLNRGEYPFAASISADEAEETVRTTGSILIEPDSQITALHYVDPRRFGQETTSLFDFTAGLNARIVAENVTISSYLPDEVERPEFFEDMRAIRTTTALANIMREAGYSEQQIAPFLETIGDRIDTNELPPGTSLRIAVEQTKATTKLVRLSIYDQNKHILTIAQNDDGSYAFTNAPEYSPSVAAFLDDTPNILPQATDLPTIHDGIYRAGLSYGMTQPMIKQLTKMLAPHVDFNANVQPTDAIEVFFSVTDESARATDNSELLFVSAKFGDQALKFYRFSHPQDNSIGYYSENGQSAKKFLLRNPTPTARFLSAFGMRRHPITGRMRMHSGVDWAAPRGTPILASGDGTVIKAGWNSGGYGRQTLIQHANGYVSSYSHQTRIADGVVEGARVQQGQIIGFIGSTGLSTGPHLHYELIVNGTKVDPLRVRLPEGNTLEGDVLAQFYTERQKINELLDIEDSNVELARTQPAINLIPIPAAPSSSISN